MHTWWVVTEMAETKLRAVLFEDSLLNAACTLGFNASTCVLFETDLWPQNYKLKKARCALITCEIEVDRSSVEIEHRPNIRPKASASFGSATLQHSAEVRDNARGSARSDAVPVCLVQVVDQ